MRIKYMEWEEGKEVRNGKGFRNKIKGKGREEEGNRGSIEEARREKKRRERI